MARLKVLNESSGYLMVLIVIMGTVFMLMIAAITSLSNVNLKSARTSLGGLSALEVAEAGVDNAIFNLNKDNSYIGTNSVCPISTTGSSPSTLFNDSVKGKGTFETCITNGTIANEKIIYATGKVYLPSSAAKPLATRKLKVVLIGTYSGTYGVQTGPGGLILSNSAQIVNGDVYVGGKITMSNSAQIGSTSNPLNVWAAFYSCPQPTPDGSYPKLCTSGQPISLSNQAHIYGSVNANNQTDGSGMSNPGLVGSSGVANSTLPNYDRAAQKAAVTSTITAAAASCSGNQTRSWPANVHITGDVSISNNCVVTVQGNAWIDGKLSVSNRGILKVDNSVATMPTIMIDGSNGLSLNNQASVSSNSSAIGIQFITFWSKAACSPDCANVTGSDLGNTVNTTTININNQGLSAGSYLYARWSKVEISNGGSIGQVLGQTIEFDNSGSITLGTVSGGTPAYTYAVRYYEQL